MNISEEIKILFLWNSKKVQKKNLEPTFVAGY